MVALQIVANDRNGLDVDKYDYLMRDSMYCNVPISVCINRIFSFVKASAPCITPGVPLGRAPAFPVAAQRRLLIPLCWYPLGRRYASVLICR